MALHPLGYWWRIVKLSATLNFYIQSSSSIFNSPPLSFRVKLAKIQEAEELLQGLLDALHGVRGLLRQSKYPSPPQVAGGRGTKPGIRLAANLDWGWSVQMRDRIQRRRRSAPRQSPVPTQHDLWLQDNASASSPRLRRSWCAS